MDGDIIKYPSSSFISVTRSKPWEVNRLWDILRRGKIQNLTLNFMKILHFPLISYLWLILKWIKYRYLQTNLIYC